MADFSKKHLKVIADIRDRIDKDEEFRYNYIHNEMLHSAVEWFCNKPIVNIDPFEAWKYAYNYYQAAHKLGCCNKLTGDEWESIMRHICSPRKMPDPYKSMIDLIRSSLVENDGFKKLYDDNIDFHDRVEYYLHTPKTENTGTDKDPMLKELVIDMLMELLKSHDAVKQFKALLSALDVLDSCEDEKEEEWWV